jgi:hypothetical protein
MRKLFYILISVGFIFSACTEVDFDEYFGDINSVKNYPEFYSAKSNYITDLCLIYNGRPNAATSTLINTKEAMKPYVYYTDQAGKVQFLFDGFLFLEIVGPDGSTLQNKPEKANMETWNWYLDRQFDDNLAISAVDQVLDSLDKLNIKPLRKRKIVIGIPVPLSSNLVFGTIDSKEITMNTVANRVMTTKWFIDETLKRWDEKGFKHLELAGFYYNEEHTRDLGDSIMPQTAAYLKSKDLTFYWIPYFGGTGAKDWKKLGVDIAYQQPNYFFKKATTAGVPASRLNFATHFASKYNMAVEFEFDDNITDTLYQRKFNEYYQCFVDDKVFEYSPVAYYEGGGTWYRMSKTGDNLVSELYHKLATMIVSRQKRADQLK